MTRYRDGDDDAAYRKAPLPGYEHRHKSDDLTAEDIDICLKYLRWLHRKSFDEKLNRMSAEVGLPPLHKTPMFLKEKRAKEIYNKVLWEIRPHFQHTYLIEGERDQVRKELFHRQKELTTPFRRVSKRCMVPLTTVTKFVSDGKRVIRGVASSSRLDRQGDIVDPRTGRWQVPLPLLWAHDHQQPIGSVRSIEVRGEEILIEAEIVKGVAKAEEIWTLIEAQAIDSFSIGFQASEWDQLPDGGRLYRNWTLLEVSVVSVPANPDAKIRRSHAGPVKLKSSGGIKLIRAGSDRERALRNGAVALIRGGTK